MQLLISKKILPLGASFPCFSKKVGKAPIKLTYKFQSTRNLGGVTINGDHRILIFLFFDVSPCTSVHSSIVSAYRLVYFRKLFVLNNQGPKEKLFAEFHYFPVIVEGIY